MPNIIDCSQGVKIALLLTKRKKKKKKKKKQMKKIAPHIKSL